MDSNNNYIMRFLYELNYDFILNIYTDKDKTNILISHNEFTSNLNAIPLDVQIIYPQIDSLGYKRFYYDLINKITEKKEYTGSFPIISSDYKNDLKIVFLSCNDNLNNVKKWNVYHEGIRSSLWKKISKHEHDIVIHMGDQIYADSVGQLWMDGKINKVQVEKYLKNLYINTYSEKVQSEVMRNVLNFNIFDDHDIKDCYATPNTPNTIENKKFNKYKKIAYEYLIKYQLSLVNKNFTDLTDLSYSLDIGKYKFVMVDMRSQFYYTGQIFTKKILKWVKLILKTNVKNDIYFILPRPIGGTGKYLSWLTGLYLKDAIDEPIHPHNYEQTFKFLNLIFKYKIKSEKNIRILAGDVHECYKKTIHFKHNNYTYQINQYISSAITRSCRANDSNFLVKMLFNLTDNINFLFLYGIGNKKYHSMYNSFGKIDNDNIKLYFKKEKNII